MHGFRFEFRSTVPLAEAEQSLQLALYAVEGLFGQASVRLDAGYRVDQTRNAIVVDARTEVGAAVARVYAGLLIREFGDQAFHVRRVETRGEPGKADGRAA